MICWDHAGRNDGQKSNVSAKSDPHPQDDRAGRTFLIATSLERLRRSWNLLCVLSLNDYSSRSEIAMIELGYIYRMTKADQTHSEVDWKNFRIRELCVFATESSFYSHSLSTFSRRCRQAIVDKQSNGFAHIFESLRSTKGSMRTACVKPTGWKTATRSVLGTIHCQAHQYVTQARVKWRDLRERSSNWIIHRPVPDHVRPNWFLIMWNWTVSHQPHSRLLPKRSRPLNNWRSQLQTKSNLLSVSTSWLLRFPTRSRKKLDTWSTISSRKKEPLS